MSTHNGILLLDKPVGASSHDLVRQVRKILKMSAVGHCGTLDPMASGLMILLLGEATKLSKYILEQNKTYVLKAELGYETDTLDATGEVVERSDQSVAPEDLDHIAHSLQGVLDLPVPAYSAVKVDGKRLYKSAREGEQVEAPIRQMKFFDLKTIEVEKGMGSWEIHCSKGSYIRAWVKALGERSACGATLTALRRTASYPFRLEQALTLEELQATGDLAGTTGFLPMNSALPHLKSVHITGKDQKLLVNGQISHRLRAELITRYQPGRNDQAIKVLSQENGQMLALVGLEKQKGFVIRRVFNH